MIKIKGSISIGYSNASVKFSYDISELDITEYEWKSMTQKEKDEVLDEVLETELSNHLDTACWVEEDE